MILVAYYGSPSSRRALDRAIAEARDSHTRITVLSVAEMPLNPDAPRFFGTLYYIAPGEGEALAPPPGVVAHLTEASDILASAGFDPDLAWSAGEPGARPRHAEAIRARTIRLVEHHDGFFGLLRWRRRRSGTTRSRFRVILA